MAELWLTNPLEDIFRTTKHENPGYLSRLENPEICMGRNARESIQLAVYAGESKIIDATVSVELKSGSTENEITFDCGGVRLIPASSNSINIGTRVKRASLPGELPEAIDPSPMEIFYRQTGSFFITANTSRNTPPGVYEYKIILNCRDGYSFEPLTFEHLLTVRVFSITLPDPSKSSYSYENWFNCCGYSPEADNQRMVECNEKIYDIKNYSDEWFTLIKNYALQMKKERINVITVPIYSLLYGHVRTDENGQYIFDFSLFDKFLDTFLKYCDVKYFCGFHLIIRNTKVPEMETKAWDAESVLVAWLFDEKKDFSHFAWAYMTDERAWKHLEMLVKSLRKHLIEKGIADMWIQHISDEVTTDEQLAIVKKAYQKMHEWAPEFKCVDATLQDSLEKYGKDLDIHVPQIDVHNLYEEAYTQKLKKGEFEIWSYTSLKPQFNYLSRLDDFKLIATRLIHWYNFKYGITGYLHWSWNLWFYGNCPNEPYRDCCCDGWPLDGWVVLPDKENLSVFETIRQRENSSGIEDYEILRLASKRNPERTRLLTDILIDRANDFTLDTNLFFRVRNQLLLIASDE